MILRRHYIGVLHFALHSHIIKCYRKYTLMEIGLIIVSKI